MKQVDKENLKLSFKFFFFLFNLLFSSFKSDELPDTMNLIEKPQKLNYAYIKYTPLDVITGEPLKDENQKEIILEIKATKNSCKKQNTNKAYRWRIASKA